MVSNLVKYAEEKDTLWGPLLENAYTKYTRNPNFCNNIQYRGAWLATSALATVEAVVCLAATIFSGFATLFTCFKNDKLKRLTVACGIRILVNGAYIPSAIIAAVIHPTFHLFNETFKQSAANS